MIGLFIAFTGLYAKLDDTQAARANKAITDALGSTALINGKIGEFITDDKKFVNPNLENFTEDETFVKDIELLSSELSSFTPKKALAAIDISTKLSLYIKFTTAATKDDSKAKRYLEELKDLLKREFDKKGDWLN